MSDIEEPAAKMSKLEEMADGEDMENGQEEWLSEDILTDDEYPAADQDQSDSNANTSQEEGYTDSMDQSLQNVAKSRGENIERTLNNLENSMSSTQAELPEELGAFLVRKTDKRAVEDQQAEKDPESELDESTKQSEDDGNDTDDLLRMLGEGDSKKKEASGAQSARQKEGNSSDEDDDEYIFEGATVKKLRVSKELQIKDKVKKLMVSKGVMLQKASRALPEDTGDKDADKHTSSKISSIPKLKTVKFEGKDARSMKIVSKAVQEDLSDLDEDSVQKRSMSSLKKRRTSSDEAITMKRMFDVHSKPAKTSPAVAPAPPVAPAPRRGINAVKTVTKRVISIDPKGPTIQSTPVNPPVKFITKLAAPPVVPRPRPPAPAPRAAAPRAAAPRAPAPRAPAPRAAAPRAPAKVHEELDEDELMNEEFPELESDEEDASGQRLMRPERMDEEVPTDDSQSDEDEDSYYDEMPSSESEDADDWFTLDIRGERAADYIPMLGDDAKSLLTAEQQRAAARLGALRRSASALVAGRRSLAAQLRAARSELAQIDAQLVQ